MRRAGLTIISLAVAACSSQDGIPRSIVGPSASLSRSGDDAFGDSETNDDRGARGAVYTLTNSTTANAVRAFARARDGSLAFVADYPTGGTGTGGGLGNQGAIVFAGGGRYLLAVNPGSNQLSSFRITNGGLKLISTVSSGGHTPVSVSSSRDLAYVLNSGGTGNISGFRIGDGGVLDPIDNSTRALSSATAGAAEVRFSPTGEQLVVTEKATSKILAFQIGDDDRPGNAVVNVSAGKTPFGFEFTDGGLLIVSDAFGGAPGASAASSYRLTDDGLLSVRSALVPTTQTAACWVAIAPGDRFAYLTNTNSGTITGYRILFNGTLERLDPTGITATTGAGPTDASFARGGRFLYALNATSHSISAFRVSSSGALTAIGTTTGLAAGGTGLASR